MFLKKSESEDAQLNETIDVVLSEMRGFDAHSDEYAQMVNQLTKLYALKVKPDRISKDTVAIICGNLVGIVLIIGYERTNIVTSKALNFLIKLR